MPARPAKRSSLKSYRAKRDFSQTEEPKGAAVRKASAGELRYLIQKHDATRLHYDFRVYEKKELIFAGKVGTGFDRAESARLVKKLKPLAQKTPSFKAVPNLARRGAIWIKPKLVAQINFTEWTGGNSLRHPSYQGLREDKPAKHVVREEKATEPEGSRANQIWARTTPRHPLRMNPIGYSSRVQEAGNLVSRSELTKTREKTMAKKAAKKRKYSRSSGSDVKSEMRRYKKGTAKSGRGGKGGKVKSRKQAIAIGLSKARKKGKKVPKKRATKRKT